MLSVQFTNLHLKQNNTLMLSRRTLSKFVTLCQFCGPIIKFSLFSTSNMLLPYLVLQRK